MELQTKIKLSKQAHDQIDYQSKLLLLGSCFAENIGDKLEYFKFKNKVNPFGILFHPVALENVITRSINEEHYEEQELFELNEQWHCFDAHSILSAPTKAEVISNLNDAIRETKEYINTATHVVITLGTSWVYRYVATGNIVANCHKVPQKKFGKELLSIDEIVQSLEAIIALVRSINNAVTFIFTVSPVRHIKDGITQNSRSKSHLISAVHEVINNRNDIYYFPSYEFLMDELRDYRFFKEDMIHPSQTAIDYVWNAFSRTWVDEKASKVMLKVEEIQKGMQHKTFNPESKQHQVFLKQLELKKNQLTKNIPQIKF